MPRNPRYLTASSSARTQRRRRLAPALRWAIALTLVAGAPTRAQEAPRKIEPTTPPAAAATAPPKAPPYVATSPVVAPPPSQQADDERRAAYQGAIDTTLPANPAQIMDLARRLDATLRAAQTPFGPPPAMTNTVATINLSPGAPSTELYLAAGYPTTITFIDSTGQPWPVANVTVGEKKSFEAAIPVDGGPMVTVTPISPYPMPVGLTVLLKDLSKPITFRLNTGTSKIVHASFDARIPQYGPSAKIPLIDRPTGMTADEPSLLGVLDGQAPANAKRLKIAGADDRTRAWIFDGALYLRMPHTLLSPAYTATIASGDGMIAYKLANTPVIVISDSGTPVTVHLTLPETHAASSAPDVKP